MPTPKESLKSVLLRATNNTNKFALHGRGLIEIHRESLDHLHIPNSIKAQLAFPFVECPIERVVNISRYRGGNKTVD